MLNDGRQRPRRQGGAASRNFSDDKDAHIGLTSWRLADLVNDIGDNGSRPGHFSRHRPSKSNGGSDTVRDRPFLVSRWASQHRRAHWPGQR